jgi:hypothetical protein
VRDGGTPLQRDQVQSWPPELAYRRGMPLLEDMKVSDKCILQIPELQGRTNQKKLPNSYSCRVGAVVVVVGLTFSPLLAATLDPHGSLAKLDREDVATWQTVKAITYSH